MDVITLQQAQAWARKNLRPLPPVSFVTGSKPTRRATAVLSCPKTTAAAAVKDYDQRVQITLPVQTVRWRLRFANRNVLANTSLTTPMTVTPVYIGTPVGQTVDGTPSGGRWYGDFSAAPTQALAGFSVPTDGSDYVSPWVTNSALQFFPYKTMALDWGFTTTASGTGIAQCNSEQYAGVQTSGSQYAGVQVMSNKAAKFVARGANFGDVRIEYEFAEAVPIGLFVGTSIEWGNGDGDVQNNYQGALTHEAWPVAAGLQGRFCAINAAVPSGVLTTFASGNNAWGRLDLATTIPDFAFIGGMTNDVANSTTTQQGAYMTLIAYLQSIGIYRIIVGTYPPRSDIASYGALAADAAAGATTVSSTISIGNGARYRIGDGRAREAGFTTGAPTGAGPYTLTVPALALAHLAGTRLYTGSEYNRREMNDWLLSVPQGIQSVIDFDRALASAYDVNTIEPNYVSTDGLHPIRAGYQRMANLAAPLGL